MVINALIKKASVYAGNSEMDKVKSCYDKCFVIDSQCPDALIHRARVSQCVFSLMYLLIPLIRSLSLSLSLSPSLPHL